MKIEICVPRDPGGSLETPLKMGGASPTGQVLRTTRRYLQLNNRPILPVMGEIHFSRYPRALWEPEILKMKSGGLSIIATYVFWIHHEEARGEFDWSGSRDLRAFVELCANHGLWVFLRIGPFCHGECRNGGIPDWLWDKIGRKLYPDHMDAVRRLYTEIAGQVEGLLFKEGGPVIGIQLENEYCQGDEGIPYIRALKSMARWVGLEVPLYTITGWGNASLPPYEVIPTYGGYPAAPWDMRNDRFGTEHSINFFFTRGRDSPILQGKDQDALQTQSDEIDNYPFLTCELGGGNQITYLRRPIISTLDVVSIAITKLGSGANLLGYYVFHGGTNPTGKHTPMHETIGRPSMLDYPTFSYDFQAPISEFGEMRPWFHELRLIHLFLQEFGSLLAPMAPVFPDQVPVSQDDVETPRVVFRTDGQGGFLFFNTYDRYNPRMHAVKDFQVDLRLGVPGEIGEGEERLLVPKEPVTLPEGQYGMWPVNVTIGVFKLRYATAQIICQIQAPGTNSRTILFAKQIEGIVPEFVFYAPGIRDVICTGASIEHGTEKVTVRYLELGEGIIERVDVCKLTAKGGNELVILPLRPKDETKLWKFHLWGEDRIIFSDCDLFSDGDHLTLLLGNEPGCQLAVYPPFEGQVMCTQTGQLAISRERDLFTELKFIDVAPARFPPDFSVQLVAKENPDPGIWGGKRWTVTLPNIDRDAWHLHELFIEIQYMGDHIHVSIGDELVWDDYFAGPPARIGLRRWMPTCFERGITIEITPLERDHECYLETAVDFPENVNEIARINSLQLVPVQFCTLIGTARK